MNVARQPSSKKYRDHQVHGQFTYLKWKHAEVIAGILPVLGTSPWSLNDADAILGRSIPRGYVSALIRIKVIEEITPASRAKYNTYIPAVYQFTQDFVDYVRTGRCNYIEAVKCQQQQPS